MRKNLLATTAVVGVAFGAVEAAAQMPVVVEPPRALAGSAAGLTVRLGGYFDFRAGLINDDADRAAVGAAGYPVSVPGARASGRAGRQRVDFQSDMELNVFVDGKATNGLQYGLVMEFQIDNVGAGVPGTTLDTDEVFGYVSHPMFGTLRFGDEDNAGNLLQVRTPLIRGADTDNYWDEFAFRNSATLDGSPSLFTSLGDGADATKIVYLSPQFFGFDFGVSYAPNSGEGERFSLGTSVSPQAQTGGAAQRDRSARRNELAAGLRYRGTFGGIGVATSFSMMRSDSPARYAAATSTPLHGNITAYSAGLQLSAYGFTVGGEYTWGDYVGQSVGLVASNRGRDASRHWVVGATYNIPGTSLQIGGFYGEARQDNGPGFEDRRQNVWSTGVNYALAPGMVLYATYSHMNDQNEVAGSGAASNYIDNNAARPGIQRTRNLEVYMVGTRIAF